jgi:hypothetical protein
MSENVKAMIVNSISSALGILIVDILYKIIKRK